MVHIHTHKDGARRVFGSGRHAARVPDARRHAERSNTPGVRGAPVSMFKEVEKKGPVVVLLRSILAPGFVLQLENSLTYQRQVLIQIKRTTVLSPV